MNWINAKEKLPTLNGDSDYESETFLVTIYQGDELRTVAMERVRTVVRGKVVERWEWHGRISPWEVVHWMPLPSPPEQGR